MRTNTETEQTTCTLWLRVEEPSHSSGTYAHVHIGVSVEVAGSKYGRDEHRGLYLRDFAIRNQIGEDSVPANPDYARTYCFKPYSVESYDCERMNKTFKTIASRMLKIENKLGRPTTYGQYVARIASAIGAGTLKFPGVNHTCEDAVNEVPIGVAVWEIDNWVLELGKRVRKFAGKELEGEQAA